MPSARNDGGTPGELRPTEDIEVECGTTDCTNCTKDDDVACSSGIILPEVEPELFVVAGERIAATLPNDARVVLARAALQAALVD